MIPPNSTPAAPPSPFIAAHVADRAMQLGPGANDEVMIASEHAAIRAPARPCTARAPIEHLAVRRDAARQRGEPEQEQRRHEHPALAEVVGGAPAEHQEARERDRVRVDDPLQFGRGEAEARLDRGQRDVDDAQVEDDHELRHAADDQQPRASAEPDPLWSSTGGVFAMPGVAVASTLMTAEARCDCGAGERLVG